MESKQVSTDSIFVKKSLAILVAIYVIAVIAFYFLAGEQLIIRSSRSNISMLPADAATVELSDGAVVEQHFCTEIQRIESLSIQWGAYYRENQGTIIVELVDALSGEVLLTDNFDAASITEGGYTTLLSESPLEGHMNQPLYIRIHSENSFAGSSPSPLMNAQTQLDDTQLSINGESVFGTLCFSLEGQDYIWTGIHYWQFVGLGAILLSLFLFWEYRNFSHGKRSYLIGAFLSLKRYKFLIEQLVSRDFKTKYKRSVLGMFWSFLNPLLMMLVQYVVFSTIFRADIPFYPAYLLIGIVAYNFFAESCSLTLASIIGNAGLITKVYMPKYIYPMVRVLSSTINLSISLIPMVLVCLVVGVQFKKAALLSLFFFVCLALFCLGLGLLLSTAMVFFRDTQFLWSVISLMWMYCTPIFYPESILPENLKFILNINPLYYMIRSIRTCIIGGISPEPIAYFQCLLFALVTLLIGAFAFKKNQHKFILYL